MANNWFKIIIILLGIIAILYIPNSLHKNATKVEAFKICMQAIGWDNIKDPDALKLNFKVCDNLSSNFNKD